MCDGSLFSPPLHLIHFDSHPADHPKDPLPPSAKLSCSKLALPFKKFTEQKAGTNSTPSHEAELIKGIKIQEIELFQESEEKQVSLKHLQQPQESGIPHQSFHSTVSDFMNSNDASQNQVEARPGSLQEVYGEQEAS